MLCLVFGGKLGWLFTSDEDVAEAVSDLSLLLAFSMLLNGIYPVLSGYYYYFFCFLFFFLRKLVHRHE